MLKVNDDEWRIAMNLSLVFVNLFAIIGYALIEAGLVWL